MYVAQLFKPGKGWRYDRETSGGGVLITQNSHLIDLLLWIFGPIGWVSGHTKSWCSKGVEDFAHAYLRFDSGLTGYIDTSWSLRHHRTVDIWIDVQGTDGNLTVTDDELKLYLEHEHESYPRGWTVWKKPDLFRGVPFDIGGPEYARQDAEFLSAVRLGETVCSDAASAFGVQRVVDAIYQSAESGGKQVSISGGQRGRN